MAVSIRKAGPQDLNLIDRFQQKLGLHEKTFGIGVKSEGRIRYYSIKELRKRLNSKNSLVLVAGTNGKPVGCGIGEIRKQFGNWSKYKRRGQVGLLLVEKKSRKAGIGGKIIKEFLAWFRKNKLEENIHLWVVASNSKALKFYKKQGFKDYLVDLVYKA